MRAVERGETFLVTRNGVPVAELRPIVRRVFVDTESLIASLVGGARIDFLRFRADVDDVLDQGVGPST